MAVPASGTLTMLGLAQERKFGTYGTGTIASPILMTDLINGGGLNSFPALNTISPSKPNTTTPHAMSEWYSYDQDYEQWRSFTILNQGVDEASVACETEEPDDMTLYYDSGATGTGSACPALSVTLYDDSALSSVFNGDHMWFKSTQCGKAYLIETDGFLEGESTC
tara:strand:- start:1064 stop:1561 length:498 start_codon:yes stop_codon:yes gene_type:complete